LDIQPGSEVAGLTDVIEEDLFAAIISGFSIKLSAIIHDAAASAGLETALSLTIFILLAILIATNYREGKGL
jgi:hypothetical protein